MDQDGIQRNQGTWQVADWVVDLDRRQVSRDGQALEVRDLSFRLLAALLADAPGTVARDALMDRVWGRTVVGDETLKQRVMLLRRALGEGSDALILTDRGRGYRIAELPRAVTETRNGSRFRQRVSAVGVLLVLLLIAGLLTSGLHEEVPGGTATGTATEQRKPAAQRSIGLQLDEIQYLSAPQDADRFIEGLREALVSQLVNLEQVQLQRRGNALPERAARELGLASRLALSGSYQQAGYQARVVIRIEDLETGLILSAQEFNVDVSRYERLNAQREIAERVAEELRLQLPLLVSGR